MAATKTPSDRDLYLELVQRFPLRPLHSDEDLDRAIGVIDELARRDELTTGESDYLYVLGELVHKYEESAHPITPASDAEMVRFLLESRGLNQVQLAGETLIPVSTISEVLSGKRRLSRQNVGILSRFFQVSPAVFVFEWDASSPDTAG